MTWAPPTLYAILDSHLTAAAGRTPAEVLDAWLETGVRLIQWRAKGLSLGPMLAQARALARQAEAAGATLIINDRADVAALAGASGVHVGQADLRPAAVRAQLGPTAIVGLSTHSEAQVQAACDEPISYLAIGPVYQTSTKAEPGRVVGLEGVAMAAAHARRAGLPLVAIGGITAETAPAVLLAGADSVAVASALLRAPATFASLV